MKNKVRDERPRGLKPIKRIEVSDEHFKRRVILMIVFLAIGAVAIGFFISSLLTTEPGWEQVEVNASDASSGEDFIFTYYFGGGDSSPTEEKKRLTALYSDLCVKAYRAFSRYEHFDGVGNVYDINTHPNEIVEVDAVLYEALLLFEECGSRYLYQGALHNEYSGLFFGIESSPSSEDYDPYTNAETAAYLGKVAAYAASPEAITLELLGNNRVRLAVSQEYLTFANENGIEVFIDFFRAKNAFVIDYFADTLIEYGFTNGCISSYDGYVRNLDDRGTRYVLNLFDRTGTTMYQAATMQYDKRMAIVSLQSFSRGAKDGYDFYTAPNGKVIPPYVGGDGLYRTAVSSMTSYSETKGCAEIFLRLVPLYVSDELDEGTVISLQNSGIFSIWLSENILFYHDSALELTYLYEDEQVKYTKRYVGAE